MENENIDDISSGAIDFLWRKLGNYVETNRIAQEINAKPEQVRQILLKLKKTYPALREDLTYDKVGDAFRLSDTPFYRSLKPEG